MPVRPAVKPAAAIAAFLSIKNPFRQVLLTTKASLRKLLTSARQQRGLNASKFANNHEIISEGLYDFSGGTEAREVAQHRTGTGHSASEPSRSP